MYNTEKSGATFMSYRFLYVYKYRLNGNVGVILQGQGEPSILYYLSYMFLCVNSTNVMYFLQQENLMRFHNLALSLLKPNK